jgi:DNA polymerase III delta subunit
VRELKRLLAVDVMDQHHASGETLTPSDLAGLLREPPLAGAHRLLVIESAEALEPACLALLTEHARTATSSTHVLLSFDADPGRTAPWSGLGSAVVIERYASADSSAASGFGLVNAIARRDAGAALAELDSQLADGKEVLEVVGLLGWQLQRWLTVKRGGDAGLQPWQLDRVRGEVASRSLETLHRSLADVWAVDTAAKRGQLPLPRAAVEAVVVELCCG